VKGKKDPAKVTRPNLRVLMEGVAFARCNIHGTVYPKDGRCPKCEPESKPKAK
jgi:hypothetical protein